MQCKSTTLTHTHSQLSKPSMKKFNFIRDGASKLPPGFRFQPTDEEIVFQYLARKILSSPLPASVIPELDVFAFHPSNLPGDSERDRYFFGSRGVGAAGRSSGCVGFWKATGSEKRIVCSKRMPIVGIRRTLVFYQGRHPRALRTHWFMHVYYIALQGGLNQIGKWVLCHVFTKKRALKDEVCRQQRYDHFAIDADSSSSCSSSSASDSSILTEVSSSSADDTETSVPHV